MRVKLHLAAEERRVFETLDLVSQIRIESVRDRSVKIAAVEQRAVRKTELLINPVPGAVIDLIEVVIIPFRFPEEGPRIGKEILRKGPFGIVPIGRKIQGTAVAERALRHAASALASVCAERKEEDLFVIADAAVFETRKTAGGKKGVMEFVHDLLLIHAAAGTPRSVRNARRTRSVQAKAVNPHPRS